MKEQVWFLRVIFPCLCDFTNLLIFAILYNWMQKIAIHRSKYPPRLWLYSLFWQFPVLKNFPENFQMVLQSWRSSLTHKKLFYPSKLSKVAAQDYFSAKVATTLHINYVYRIRKHQKLQRPANTNRLNWRREVKWAAENAKVTHHDDNFEFLFQYDCS